MLETHLEGCTSHGTRDWDLELVIALAFTLQYAFYARVGDMTRSHAYTGKEYLTYKDIEITLREGHRNPPSVQDLEAYIQLRYTKGQSKY